MTSESRLENSAQLSKPTKMTRLSNGMMTVVRDSTNPGSGRFSPLGQAGYRRGDPSHRVTSPMAFILVPRITFVSRKTYSNRFLIISVTMVAIATTDGETCARWEGERHHGRKNQSASTPSLEVFQQSCDLALYKICG